MGSQRALGEAVGIGQAAVGNWVMRGSKVPPEHCAAIEVATGRAVTRQDLRPDDWQKIWPELVTTAGTPEIPAVLPAGIPRVCAASEPAAAQGVANV